MREFCSICRLMSQCFYSFSLFRLATVPWGFNDFVYSQRFELRTSQHYLLVFTYELRVRVQAIGTLTRPALLTQPHKSRIAYRVPDNEIRTRITTNNTYRWIHSRPTVRRHWVAFVFIAYSCDCCSALSDTSCSISVRTPRNSCI